LFQTTRHCSTFYGPGKAAGALHNCFFIANATNTLWQYAFGFIRRCPTLCGPNRFHL
jgi:hypothetical protein